MRLGSAGPSSSSAIRIVRRLRSSGRSTPTRSAAHAPVHRSTFAGAHRVVPDGQLYAVGCRRQRRDGSVHNRASRGVRQMALGHDHAPRVDVPRWRGLEHDRAGSRHVDPEPLGNLVGADRPRIHLELGRQRKVRARICRGVDQPGAGVERHPGALLDVGVSADRPDRQLRPRGIGVDLASDAPLVVMARERPLRRGVVLRLARPDERHRAPGLRQMPRSRASDQPPPDNRNLKVRHTRNVDPRGQEAEPDGGAVGPSGP